MRVSFLKLVLPNPPVSAPVTSAIFLLTFFIVLGQTWLVSLFQDKDGIAKKSQNILNLR